MNLEQIRAANAFSFVESVSRERDLAEPFLGLARKLPVMLQTNGLLATWAHLLAKNGAEHGRMARALLEHLRQEAVGVPRPRSKDPRQVLTDWTEAGTTGLDLRRLTREAIAYSVWLKRAAEALCDQDKPAASAGATT